MWQTDVATIVPTVITPYHPRTSNSRMHSWLPNWSKWYISTISDQEFETFWPLAKFYHNQYTLGLQIWYSCEYISHEHEYIFYFFIVQLWKLTEASRSSKAIVSGDWNGCHIQVTSNCQILIGWMLLTLAFSIHIWSAQNHTCHAQQTKNQNPLNCKRSSPPFCSIFCIWGRIVY